MSFADAESSSQSGKPLNLYLFKGAEPTLESMIKSITLGPGATEFGYGTTKVTRGTTILNGQAGLPQADIDVSLNDLSASAPGLEEVSLVVSWHGSDLRAAWCGIYPKVETATGGETPYTWNVGGVDRASAFIVSQISGKPAIGGAPSDRSIYEAILAIKARGWKVCLYPFINMDIATGNALPNPYGGTGQPVYPWRGRITCTPAPGIEGSPDGTSDAGAEINGFFGLAEVDDFGWDATNKHVTNTGSDDRFRHFILHMAKIAQVAGVDRFLLGSELVGLTSVRRESNRFPAVENLITLAADVRSMLGPDVKIGYGADWSEYHSYRPADGSGDVFFQMDALYADENIDFIGIDNYMPLSDWRDGLSNLDKENGFTTLYDRRYLAYNILGGEYFDWYYASDAARNAQTRSSITDGAYGKPWVYRQKDILNWWENYHYNRPGGVESGTHTAWVPQSKPIVFTEIGVPAINKGTNQPNIFYDPKSSESAAPHYSTGARDDAIQRAGIEAVLEFWKPSNGRNPASTVYTGNMIDWEAITVWTWDARPYPTFPKRTDYWGDAGNWSVGHWLTGRIEPGRSFDMGVLGPFAYTDAEVPIVRDGITYTPWPISRSAITASGSLDKSNLTVRAALGTDVAALFLGYPPSSVVNLIVVQGHVDLDPDVDYKACWTGRVLSCSKEGSEDVFTCEPIATSMRRNGLRQAYSIGCTYVLYGPDCRANKKNATQNATVASVAGGYVTLADGWDVIADSTKFLKGMMEWDLPDGSLAIRTIRQIKDGTKLYLSGDLRNLEAGSVVRVILGCNHLAGITGDCYALHHNIWNFGGQPFIPRDNPLNFVNKFS